MKDYFAIIGVATAITAAAGVVAWNALSEVGKSNDQVVPVVASAAPQPISIPVNELPEANSESLKNALALSGQEAEEQTPVITIEEIDPKDRKQSIKARLEQAKAEVARQSEAKKRKLEDNAKKRQADKKKKAAADPKIKDVKKAEQKKKSEIEKAKSEKAKASKAAEMKKADMAKKAKAKKKEKAKKAKAKEKETKAKEPKVAQDEKDEKSLLNRIDEMKSDDKEDPGSIDKDADFDNDPGRIVFETRPEPFPTPVEKLEIPEPMELLNANNMLLTKIVNSSSGPSPDQLHGTWEVMPCHSSVGVIATRSFKTNEVTPGTGPYYEIVQFYSDPEKKVFGLRTETTVYVSLDEKHMLAAVNANTNLPKFSVLRKINSQIEGSDETEDEMSDADLEEEDFPNEEGEIVSVQADKKTEKKQLKKTKKPEGSAKKMSKESSPKKPAKDGTNASKKVNSKESPKTKQKKLTQSSKSKI